MRTSESAVTESTRLRFVAVSLDCADPAELAEFYLRLLGGRLLVWPGSSIVHLDLTAGDELEEPVRRAVALGARRADPQPGTGWTVLLDPAGHPFCITTYTPPPEPRTG